MKSHHLRHTQKQVKGPGYTDPEEIESMNGKSWRFGVNPRLGLHGRGRVSFCLDPSWNLPKRTLLPEREALKEPTYVFRISPILLSFLNIWSLINFRDLPTTYRPLSLPHDVFFFSAISCLNRFLRKFCLCPFVILNSTESLKTSPSESSPFTPWGRILSLHLSPSFPLPSSRVFPTTWQVTTFG